MTDTAGPVAHFSAGAHSGTVTIATDLDASRVAVVPGVRGFTVAGFICC